MEFLIVPEEWFVPSQISQSALKEWGSCPAKYFYNYQLRLQPAHDEYSAASQGRLFHYLMNAFFHYHDNVLRTEDSTYAHLDKMIILWQADNQPDYVALAEQMDTTADLAEVTWLNSCEHVLQVAWNLLCHYNFFEDYEVIASEHHTRYRCGDFEFHGYVDLIARNLTTGMIEVIDFKTTKAMSDYETRKLDYQLPLYVFAVCAEFCFGLEEVQGVYWQVKNAVPRLPKRNKNGDMSRQKITTTWDVYQGALLEAGLDPADYADMEEKLSSNESESYWYSKLAYTYSPVVQANIEKAANAQATALVHTCENEGPFPPILNYNCRSCRYRELCNALLYDMDVEGVIETQFKHKE